MEGEEEYEEEEEEDDGLEAEEEEEEEEVSGAPVGTSVPECPFMHCERGWVVIAS